MHWYALTVLCLTLFALNSILCRAALIFCEMGPLQYTAIRNLSAAAMLAFLCLVGVIKASTHDSRGSVWKDAWAQSSWRGGFFLFMYMICFSLGYVNMPSAPGTLIINMSVQFCMLGWGLLNGLHPGKLQYTGFAIATLGLVVLMFPGLTAPSVLHSLLMAGAGFAWGVYTLVGRKATSAALATTGNFWRAAVFGAMAGILACLYEQAPVGMALVYALSAGALASALGYILWYAIVPRYSLVGASIIQLSVPIITAFLGAIFLAESITLRLIICSILILGGIYMALRVDLQAKS